MATVPSLNTEAHADQWHERRRKTLGASEVAAVVGLSKWANAYDVWDRKIHGTRGKSSMAANLGHLLQPTIGKLAAEEHGLTITAEEAFYLHQEKNWASSTIDYIAQDSSGEPVIIECKATRDGYWTDIPDYYRTQLAWQCWTAGIPKAHIAVLHASTTFKTYPFSLAEDGGEWMDEMIRVCESFWNNHVLTGIKPEGEFSADPETLASIRAIRGKTVDLPQAYIADFYLLTGIRERIKELEDAEERLKTKFQSLMNEAEILVHKNQPVITWKESESSRFDTTAFKKADPARYAEFTKPSVSRRFLVRNPKSDE